MLYEDYFEKKYICPKGGENHVEQARKIPSEERRNKSCTCPDCGKRIDNILNDYADCIFPNCGSVAAEGSAYCYGHSRIIDQQIELFRRGRF